LLLKNGWLVQSKRFDRHQNLGNPIIAVRRLSQWASDEIVYLDISRGEEYDLRRDDLNHPNRQTFLDIIADVAKETFMPLTVGGKVRTLEDFEKRLSLGADKIAVNTQAVRTPELITNAAREFGAQCVVVSIDVKSTPDGPRVCISGGKEATDLHPAAWAREAQERGAGEILLNSIDRDGTKQGFDIPLVESVCDAVKIPVIACGGAGEWSHLAEVFDKTSADAVSAANMLHHIDQSVFLAKKYLVEKNHNVRKPDLFSMVNK
jgi:cyclase